MKHFTMLVLALSIVLCACAGGAAETTDGSEAAETAKATETMAQAEPTRTDPVETTVVVTEAADLTEPAEPITVYAGAVEDYLLPLEQYSSERQFAPEFVMVHFTSAVVNYRNDPYNIGLIRDIFEDYEISVHYIIERDGTVRCYIPEDRVAWHAGTGEFADDPKYTNKMNHYAIGIEVVAIGSQSDMAQYLTSDEYAALDDSLIGYTEAQYASLQELVRDICTRYGIPMDRQHVIGHEEYSPDKTDPGELLNWGRILPEITG